ncbi:arginine--tRNA ligase [Methylophilaceae bacterium]|nr:arginine--tRNA ligase [Methylophilaceae bacterium]
MKDYLTNLLDNAIKNLVENFDKNIIQVSRPKQIQHGDFSTNVSLPLAKIQKKPPLVIANEIVKHIPASPLIEKVEIAGAGYINFFLSSEARVKLINLILMEKENFGKSSFGKKQKVQVEFVSANPTGPLHVGHGRGAAIGDSIARLLDATGWDVTKEFYYNDAGAQINSLSLSVQARAKKIGPTDKEFPKDGYQGEYINEIADGFLSKAEFNFKSSMIRPSGDAENLQALKEFSVAYLRHEQDLDLEAFNVDFNVFSLESSLYKNGQVDQIVKMLIENGHTYEKDDALWLKTTSFGDDKDRVMRKTDGEYTYFVPDIAYHLDKWERGFKRVINEQGADHHSTINRVRGGLQALDMQIPLKWPEYILHQMITVMKNKKEVKISKRAGSYVTLRDLIDEVGCDATRYFLTARRPDSQLIFDIDLAKTKNNENPVYYIQYAHARISRVLEQWNGNKESLSVTNGDSIKNLNELRLIKSISEFPEVVFQAAEELAPHQIANYLKDCAAEFHSYYNDTKFLIDDKNIMENKLALIRATQFILSNGLRLLGISAPNKM